MAETMIALAPLPVPGLEPSMDSLVYHSATMRSVASYLFIACIS